MSPRATVTEDALVGITLADKYRVVDAIARGGMGRVYRAVQEPLGREVALKVLDIKELQHSTGKKKLGEDFQRRFFLEAASCAKLQHPNTIVIHDYGQTEDDTFYIAMELLVGPTLAEVISRDAPLPIERAIHIALQICGSLGEAHHNGMVHRDLKPSNVMLTPRGADPDFVKVLDFGLVKQDNDDVDLTASGALIGTPRYMPPEQIAGTNVGPHSDIYSLGAVLYHMLTGYPPFDADSKFVLMAAHINVVPDPMNERGGGVEVPPELEAIVMKCLLKDPGDRFSSMEEVAGALVGCGIGTNSLLSAASLPASGSHTFESGSFPKAEHLGEPTLSEPRTPLVGADGGSSLAGAIAPQRKRSPLLIAALAVLAVIVFAIATGMPTEGMDPPPTATAPRVEMASPAPEPEPVAEPPAEPPVEPDPAAGRVVLTSEPTGARAHHDGVDLGDTPVTLVIPDGERWPIELTAVGYQPRTVTLSAGQGEAAVRLTRRRRRPVKASTPMDERRTDNRDPWAEP